MKISWKLDDVTEILESSSLWSEDDQSALISFLSMMNAEGMTQSYGRLWRFNNMYDVGCGLSMGKIMRVKRDSWHCDLRKETDNKKQTVNFVMV